MSFIKKPKITHPELPRNDIGLTIRDYEGALSTLCAGCGHDSISNAIMQAYFELSIEPHRVAKVSGIGCSSKTPTYFLGGAHGFNSVHGRMPSIATGANAGNRELQYIGVSGDGDSLSIGLGQFAHAIRRNVNMMYLIENNGVYGLTKGQFSASADKGSAAKKGDPNPYSPIDPVRSSTLDSHYLTSFHLVSPSMTMKGPQKATHTPELTCVKQFMLTLRVSTKRLLARYHRVNSKR